MKDETIVSIVRGSGDGLRRGFVIGTLLLVAWVLWNATMRGSDGYLCHPNGECDGGSYCHQGMCYKCPDNPIWVLHPTPSCK